MKKVREFKDMTNYLEWADTNTEDCPVLIRNEWEIRADMETECKSYKTALKRFANTFDIPVVNEWVYMMSDSCDNGYFSDRCQDDRETQRSKGSFSWSVEDMGDGLWYIYLNISGIHAN